MYGNERWHSFDSTWVLEKLKGVVFLFHIKALFMPGVLLTARNGGGGGTQFTPVTCVRKKEAD